jgi:hypothetical protein
MLKNTQKLCVLWCNRDIVIIPEHQSSPKFNHSSYTVQSVQTTVAFAWIFLDFLLILQNYMTVSKFIIFDHQPSCITAAAVAGPRPMAAGPTGGKASRCGPRRFRPSRRAPRRQAQPPSFAKPQVAAFLEKITTQRAPWDLKPHPLSSCKASLTTTLHNQCIHTQFLFSSYYTWV